MRKVFFYFDYNSRYGMGHYNRCKVIAEKLKNKKIQSYLICFLKLKKNIKNFKFIQFNDLKKKNIKNSSLIIDSYAIDHKKLKAFKNIFKKIFCIEDIPSNKFINNFAIINSNFDIKNNRYSEKNFKKIYTGINYKLISSLNLKKISKSNKKNITISFGAGKTLDRTKLFLQSIFNTLENLKFKYKIFLFMNLNLYQKNKIIKKYPNLKIIINDISKKYYEKINQSKFVISSCGTQQDELIHWKIPAIFVMIAKNQHYNFSLLQNIDKKICFNILDKNFNKLYKLLDNMINKNYEIKIVNKFKKISLGKKTSRIINSILQR